MSLADEILFRPEKAKKLILDGADVNEIDQYGYPLLSEAAIANNTDMAAFLLERGAKVDETDAAGSTALHWAVENNNLELIKLLIQHKANPNAYTRYGQPILVKPILRHQRDLKELLYRSGADLKFAQDYINTKLIGHRFALRGRVDILDPQGKFIEIDLEGFVLEFTVNLIQDSLIQFKNNFAARNLRPYFNSLQRIIDVFGVAAELLKYQQYRVNLKEHEKKIHTLLQRELLLLPVGYQGHAITFIKYGNILAKCDRGENSLRNPSVVYYQVHNLKAFNTEFLKHLMYVKHHRSFINEEIIEFLDLKPIASLDLSSQITGNCSWANVEGAIPTLLFLLLMKEKKKNQNKTREELIDTAMSIFHQWQEWDKDWALHQCVESFYDASPARKASKAALLGAVLFQSCDQHERLDIKRATKILSVLKQKDYQYILKSYLEIYEKTQAGKNLAELIDLCE